MLAGTYRILCLEHTQASLELADASLHAPTGRAGGDGAEAKPLASAESAAGFEDGPAARRPAVGEASVRHHRSSCAGVEESWLGMAATPRLSTMTRPAAKSSQGLPEGRMCDVLSGKGRVGRSHQIASL